MTLEQVFDKVRSEHARSIIKHGKWTGKSDEKQVTAICSEFGELTDFARVDSKVQRRIPAAITARGYNVAKGHHYPSAVLFRLQKGACFFCGEDIHPLPHPYSRHGYAKAYFYSKLDHYPLWGNKVLGHKVCCVRHHRGKGPTQEQIAKFNHLYSHAVFLAEFGAEEAAEVKGEAA